MTHGGKLLVCITGSLALCAAANAVTDSSGNPYQGIIERNLFGLKPPPPPPDPEAQKAPPSKITLTGITTILGNKRVLMKTPAPPGKPGEQPKGEQSYILAEGQREGDIEVIEIDEKVGSVKVNNGGVIATLTFEKDGAKLPATAPPPSTVPGMPAPNGAIPPPMRVAGTPTAFNPAGAAPSFSMPNRVPRVPGANASGVQTTTGAMLPGGTIPAATAGQGAMNVSLPSLNSPATVPMPQRSWPPEQPVSREEQMILIEAQRQHLLEQGNKAAASMLPGTSLTPTPAGANGSTPTQ